MQVFFLRGRPKYRAPDGTIPADNYLGLIQVLSGYGASNQNVRGILETMQKKPFHNPEVRARLNSMLQGKR